MFRCMRCGNTLPGPGQLCEQCEELERQEKGLRVPAASASSPDQPVAATSGASYCASCGSALPAGVQFCQNCGHQIGSAVGEAGIAGTEYAGFWIRFVAAFIDVVIIGVMQVIVRLLVGDPWVTVAFNIAIGGLYVVGFWVTQGATPGKMAMGLRVVTTNGEPLEFSNAILRWIGYYASWLTLLIGFIMIAFHGEKRGLHDLIGGTVVVRAR